MEALPSYLEGVDRHGERVTVGVPLAASAGVTETSQLGLEGASAAQFRVLRRHSGGEVAWVLVDFPFDLVAGGTGRVKLVAGNGSFGGSDLARVDGGSVTVTTGAATFHMPGDGSALLDSVLVDGDEQLASPVRPVATDTSGVTYASAAGGQVSLEENGPVKAVVRVEGRLSDGSRNPLDYTARLVFTVGRKDVEVHLTFRNARQDRLDDFWYGKLGLELAVDVPSAPTVTIADEAGSTWQATPGSSPVRVEQQAVPSHPAVTQVDSSWNYLDCNNPAPGTACLADYRPDDPSDPCRRAQGEPCPRVCGGQCNFRFVVDESKVGLGIRDSGGTILGPGNQHALAYGVLEAGSRSLAVAVRWAAQQYPLAWTIGADGRVRVHLRDRSLISRPTRLPWGGHLSGVIGLGFGTTDGEALHAHLDAPLVARASLEHYRAADVFRGDHRVVSREKEAEFAVVDGRSLRMDTPRFKVPRMTFWRKYYYDTARAWFNFWRGGSAEYVLQAIARAEFEMDAAMVHSDGFDLSQDPDIGQRVPGGKLGINVYDGEHQLTSHFPYDYLATGNERVREAITDYGEMILYDLGRNHFPFPETRQYRAWLRRLEAFTWLYEFTGDPRFEAKLREGIDQLVDEIAGSGFSSYGRDPNRGFIRKSNLNEYGQVTRQPTQEDHPRIIHTFFGAQISGESYYRLLRMMERTGFDYRLDELRDVIFGHALFLWLEAGHVGENFYWMEYDYCLDPLPDPTRTDVQNGAVCFNEPEPLSAFPTRNIYAFSRYALLIYDMTGNTQVLDDAWLVLKARMAWHGGRDLSMMQNQALLDYLFRGTPPRFAWKDLDFTVEAHGGGSYTLTWTVPPGTTRIEVKASDRTIVDWLGFDQVSRTYEYPPDLHVPYFAATRLDAPEPAAPGTEQSWDVTFETGTDAHFAVRYSTQP